MKKGGGEAKITLKIKNGLKHTNIYCILKYAYFLYFFKLPASKEYTSV